MNRPAYSFAGFRRRLLLSRVRLHVIIEGTQYDPSFYGNILETSDVIKRRGGYQLVPVEIVLPSGGKRSVLALFDYCRREAGLRAGHGSNESVAAFILDKDSDFVTGGTRRSPHVIYTKTYNVESEILEHADVGQVYGAGLSLMPHESGLIGSNISDWQERLADAWRKWIVLCCLAKYFGASCPVTFRRASTINEGGFGALNARAAALEEQAVFRASGVSAREFRARRDLIERRIDALFAKGRGRELLNGKWLPAYLDYRVAPHLPSRKLPARRMGSAVFSHGLLVLNFSGGWTSHYRDPLEAL